MILSKSVKSQGILFSGLEFISFFQDFEMHFLSEKMKSMLQSKQSDQFDTLRLTRSSCGQWFSSIACKKAKANENMDCFSLIKGQ